LLPSAPAPDTEKKELPFVELFRKFGDVPGVNFSTSQSGSQVVDIDLGKVFSPDNCQNVFAKINDFWKNACKTADEQRKSAFVDELKPDASAGVYSNVIHTMPTSVIHRGVICDGCGKHDICGMRYKCAQCADYDLCQDCIRHAVSIHDPAHMFYPISFPRFRNGGHCGGFCHFPGFMPFHHPQPQEPHPQEPQPQEPHPQEPQPQEPQPQPQPQEPQPQQLYPQPQEIYPQPVPEPFVKPKEEPKKDELLDEKYAFLQMTPSEMDKVHTLIEMGFPNVELDIYYLRYYGGNINDALIETLVQAI